MNSWLAGGLRDTIHLLAVLGHAVLRQSALKGVWDLPALKIKEECACLTSPGPMWEPWMLCGSVSLSKEVISGIPRSRKGQPAAGIENICSEPRYLLSDLFLLHLAETVSQTPRICQVYAVFTFL